MATKQIRVSMTHATLAALLMRRDCAFKHGIEPNATYVHIQTPGTCCPNTKGRHCGLTGQIHGTQGEEGRIKVHVTFVEFNGVALVEPKNIPEPAVVEHS